MAWSFPEPMSARTAAKRTKRERRRYWTDTMLALLDRWPRGAVRTKREIEAMGFGLLTVEALERRGLLVMTATSTRTGGRAWRRRVTVAPHLEPPTWEDLGLFY